MAEEKKLKRYIEGSRAYTCLLIDNVLRELYQNNGRRKKIRKNRS